MTLSSVIYRLAVSSTLLACLSCHAQVAVEPKNENIVPKNKEEMAVISADTTNQNTAYNIHTGEEQPVNLQPKDKLINMKTGESILLSPTLTKRLAVSLPKAAPVASVDANHPKYDAMLISALTADTTDKTDDLAVIVTPSQDISEVEKQYLLSVFKPINKQSQAGQEVWYTQASTATLKQLANNPAIRQVSLQPSVSIPNLPPSEGNMVIAKPATDNTATDTQATTLPTPPQAFGQLHVAQSLGLLNKLSEQSPNDNIAFSTFSLDQAAKAALLAMPSPLTAKRPNWLLAGLTAQAMSQPTAPLTDGYQNLNQVFYRQGDTLTKPYQAAYTATLAGNTQALDFGEADAASTQANEWLKTSTNGMIDDMFTPDMFSKNEAILSNVLYFKANWQSPFSAEKTKPLPFTSITGKTQTVPTMSQEFKVYHAKEKGWEYVGIPFADGSMLQLFVTPKDKASALPDSVTVTALLQTSKEQKVQLLLPKLTLEGDTLTLNEIAPEIGSWQLPNLVESKMLKNPKMLHKSVITWDEQGAEAAAASSVMVSKSISVIPTVPVDRPFVFMIRQGDEVMFTGAVRDMDAVAVELDDKPTS